MTIIYEVYHHKIAAEDDTLDVLTADDDRDEKRIGLFSSQDKAEAAIVRYRELPGFRDWPGGFRIYTATLDDGLAWEEGFFNSASEDPASDVSGMEASEDGPAA